VPRAPLLRNARLAVSLLTVIPTGVVPGGERAGGVAAWFPAVGLGLGVIGYGLARVAGRLGGQAQAPYVVAAVIVAVWALCTRGLHWDGVADVADGSWGSEDQARRLDIMADSAVGAFGATAIALVALLEVSAIGSILQHPHTLPLLTVPIVARLSATAAAWFGTPARPGGLGRSVMGRPTAGGVAVAAIPLVFAFALTVWVLGMAGGVLIGAGLVLALAVPHLLARRFGGVTGDVMGASVLLTEALLFALFALLA
jgi:adenosylcobinamide-GDP ribazoletransferase